MKLRKKKKVYIVFAVIITAMFATALAGTDTTYAASKSSSKSIKSYKKAIKQYNTKTQRLAKLTPAAKKYAKQAKSYYNKSRKTNKLSTLKKLRTKAKTSYTKAQRFDYNRQVKDLYSKIKSISYQAPSMNSYTTQALSIYNKSKATNSISSKKTYLSKIKALYNKAKSHKATLTWHDAEYRQEKVEGHYKKGILQEEKWEYWFASFCAYCASSQGTVKYYGSQTDYNNYVADVNERHPYPQTPTILPWAGGHLIIPGDDTQYGGSHRYGNYRLDNLDDWGCLWYQRNLSIKDYVDIEEPTDHMSRKHGTGYNWAESGLWVCVQDEISEQKWIDEYYKNILIRKAGWY